MKARTGLQKEVASLMHKVRGLTKSQKEWVKSHCFTPMAYSSGGKAWCSECGKEFSIRSKDKSVECPHCKTMLVVRKRIRSKSFSEENGFNIVTTCGGWQVIRSVDVGKIATKGSPAKYSSCDVLQNWIHRSGRDVIVAKKIVCMGWTRRYSWTSDSEIRSGSALDNPYTRIMNYKLRYPRMILIPELKRNGYDRNVCSKWPDFDTFVALLKHPKAETLLKAGQLNAFEYFLSYARPVERLWPQIKICIRNGYMIDDFSVWKDYMDILEYLGKDTRNAHYICPEDLFKAHYVYMEKKRRKLEEERKMEERKNIEASEAAYRKRRGRFFGIVIKVDDIDISVLQGVADVYEEGEAMHHCVYTNGYYKEKDSVLLSARRNGERIETVEFSLRKRKVVQSRGVCNSNTEWHDAIVNAVNSNSHLFLRAKES